MLHVACKAIKDFCRLFKAFQLAPSACLGSQYMGCTSLRGLSAALHEYLSCCPHYIRQQQLYKCANASLDLVVWGAVGTSFLLDVCRAEPFASEGSQRSL